MVLSVITRSGVAAAVRGATMSLKAYSTPVGSALSVSGRRAMMTTFQEKERGEEAVYMRKEDQKLLDALLKKERAQAVQGKTTERDELNSILGDHKLPDDIIDRLLHWKHN